MTKYQTRKTIRFKLVPEIGNNLKGLVDQKEESVDLSGFASTFGNFVKESKNVFLREHNNESHFCSLVEFKYRFLRTEMKLEYYQLQNKNKKSYNLSQYENLFLQRFNDSFHELEKVANNISEFCSAEKHKQQGREIITTNLKILKKKSNFEFIWKCLENVQSKHNAQGILNEYSKLPNQLNMLAEQYLNTQSEGLVVAKASFNYYTINKSPKGLNSELEKLENTGIYDLNRFKDAIKRINYYIYAQDNKQIYNGVASKYCQAFLNGNYQKRGEIASTSKENVDILEYFYLHLKYVKAFYKQTLYELSSRGEDYKVIKNLTIEEYYKKYKEDIIEDKDKDKNNYWKELYVALSGIREAKPFQNLDAEVYTHLVEKWRELNKQENTKKIKEIKKERGSVFNFLKQKGQKDQTFEKLCRLHQTVALEYGKLKAKKKAIQREKVESDLLKYWATILEENNEKYLILTPRERAFNLYQRLIKTEQIESGNKIYFFESLTFQALAKLCFNHADGQENERNKLNTFWNGIKNELPKKFQNITRLYKPKKGYTGARYLKNDQERIEFFKEVLKTSYAQSVLVFPNNIDSIISFVGDDLEDFKKEFTKIGYKREVRQPISLDELHTNYQAQIFKITSSDIQKGTTRKDHTKLWVQFWDQKPQTQYPIRLNPEISIAYREPKKNKVYGKNSNLYNPNWSNRYRDDQYILRTTITSRAFEKDFELSFKETEDIKKEISSFNQEMRLKNYAMGIDLGVKELATLALINKSKKPQLFTAYRLKADKLPYKQEGYINGGNGKKDFHLIQNFSYFTNEDLYNKTFNPETSKNLYFQECYNKLFQEVSVSALDLTTAKVINGRIYLDGDIQTIFNLKVLDVQRRIVRAIQAARSPKLCVEKNNGYDKIVIRDSDSCEEIVKFNYQAEFNSFPIVEKWQFPGNYTMGGLKLKNNNEPALPFEYLRLYFEQFISDSNAEEVLLEKINNYRKSLTANAIGVINFLYEKFSSYVVFENFDINKNNADKEDQFEGLIYNLLPEKVLQKFYHLGEVPPFKALYDLKKAEKKKSNSFDQFGNILFVNEQNTSLLCPRCEKKAYKSSSDKIYTADKSNRIFKCNSAENRVPEGGDYGSCHFHNNSNAGDYKSLDDNDKIAAFNIAKRGYRLVSDPKHG